MKLYFYMIDEDENAPLGVTRKVIEFEAKETPARYITTENHFPGLCTSIISKNDIGRVYGIKQGLAYGTEYMVILTERNDALACRSLKEYVESVIENLQKKADRQRDIVGAICAPLNRLKKEKDFI